MQKGPTREAREWKITLVPNARKRKDIPVNFPVFDVNSLGLDLLEIPSKLKANAPTNIVVKRPTKPVAPPSESSSDEEDDPDDEGEDEFSKALSAASSESLAGDEDDSEEEVLHKSLRASDSDDEDSEEDPDEGEGVISILESGEETSTRPEGGSDAGGGSSPPAPEVKPQTPEERKTELLRNWKILQMKHPHAEEVKRYSFGDEDPLEVIEKVYAEVVWDLKFKSKVQHYRQLLGAYANGVEFVSTNFFDIDMSGFGYSQSQMMTNTYDELLVELGEKTGETFISKLPVEVRLLLTMAFQTAIFFGFRYIHNNKGAAHGVMFRQQFGIAPPEPPPKPRIGGPSVTPEQLERLRRETDKKDS